MIAAHTMIANAAIVHQLRTKKMAMENKSNANTFTRASHR